jgi:hypothetical protein
MPTPADLLSEEDDEDPDDQLRMQLDQGQGANLAGAPQPPGQSGMPPPGGVMPGGAPPSPNVPGPLAALAKKVPAGKPHIRLKSKPKSAEPPPRKKLKVRLKPRSSPSISPLQGFLNSIGS